jgi:glycosyltransferase involved in cell wall biosynthesis
VAVFTKLFFAPDLKVVVNVHELMSQQLRYEHPPLLERWIHHWISRLIFRRADLIIAVAEGVKRDLVSSFGAPSEKIVVVHNPIDLELIRQRSSEPLEQAPYAGNNIRLVVAVGRLVKLKGFDLLIQAFARPARQFGAKLVIIGDGEERETLQELVTDLGLADSVFLIGERENPWKYMARADLFVLSSLTEAFPSVLGEALAVGKPILATDCSPGVREYLLNGECGQLCTPGDVGSLANGIEQLLADDALCERLTRKAAARVAPFDVPLAVREYEDALATFVEGSASNSQTTGSVDGG